MTTQFGVQVDSPRNRRRRWGAGIRAAAPLWILAILAAWWMGVGAPSAAAQGVAPTIPPTKSPAAGSGVGRSSATDRGFPSFDYFLAIDALDSGDYSDALKTFQATWRVAVRDVDGRWIDSICHYAMIGECQYRLGRTSEALDNYTQALKLFLSYRDWMLRVQFADVTPSSKGIHVQPIPWGASRRRTLQGFYPDKSTIFQGRIDNSDVVRQGGVVRPASMREVHVAEVVRCTALALRRRRDILGPVSKHHAVTGDLQKAFDTPLAPARHWSESWANIERGLVYASADQYAQAVQSLRASLVAAGKYDHPLTATALLELGRLMFDEGKFDDAAAYFEEAGYAAYRYPDLTALEEAMRYGQMTHLVSGKPGVYPPLATVAQWARQKRYRDLEASVLLLLAENLAVTGQAAKAKSALAEATRVVGTRDMRASRIGARLDFISSLVHYQANNRKPAEEALDAALKFQKKASHRLFQIAGADALATGNSKTITPRMAMVLYGKVLAEPSSTQWASDPLESLAVMTTSHETALENWFEITIAAKQHDEAFYIAELTRRHRFYSTLPLGGRLLALRWLLEGPEDLLDNKGVVQRQDLLGRYPKYAELSRQARQIQTALKAAPLSAAEFGDRGDKAADKTADKKHKDLFTQLAHVSQQQEVLLNEMAVRREPAQLVFPPIRNLRDVQKRLPPGHALWAFFVARNNLYAFMMNDAAYDYWKIADVDRANKLLPQFLRSLGNYTANGDLSVTQLKDPAWKLYSRQLADALTKGSKADLNEIPRELIVVPDGPLWYLPFEALEAGGKDDAGPLASKIRVRYAPTASLALPYRKTATAFGQGHVAVKLGKLHPRDASTVAADALVELQRVVPKAVALGGPLSAPSAVVASIFDSLIVYDDIDQPGSGGPYDWSPTQMDKGKSAGSLESWFALPFGGPQTVILPGFHTAAESALKGKAASGGGSTNGGSAGGANGSEVFLSVCGLMANGARTILISRWRTGGKSSHDLIREFAQELPHATASDAWQRSVQLVMESPIDNDAEPRIKASGDEDPPKGDHPFFWAGYLLIDSGQIGPKDKNPVAAADPPPPNPLPPNPLPPAPPRNPPAVPRPNDGE